jgi:hypothetical protein
MGIRHRAILIALVATLAACGGGDDIGVDATEGASNSGDEEASGSGGDGEGSTEDLVEAAGRQFEAFLTRDDETYFDLLSGSCRDRLGFAAVTGHLDSRHFRAGLDGVEMSALSLADVLVEGGGSTATVRLVIDGPSGELFREAQPQAWIYEDGSWHMDDCGDFREAQGGLEGVGMDRNQPLPYGGVADVNGWLVALVYVGPDDEAFVVETGGSPAGDGNQLFVAGLTVDYNGGEASMVYGDELGFAMVNGDAVYEDEPGCVGSENSLYVDPATEVGPGETVGRPYICREVQPDHATGMLLRVTHLPTGDEWWFSLVESG